MSAQLIESEPTGQGRALVALAGQPNAGKSTLFNALTGARQHIANYPGITVEKKSGRYGHGGREIEVVDLPGVYSLASLALEERVARRFVVDEHPSVIVNVLDASTLQRGLSMSFQLMELGRPCVLVLNMIDVARRRGLDIDVAALERRLGVPVVATVGRRRVGIDALRGAIALALADADTSGGLQSLSPVSYGVLERPARELERRLADCPAVTQSHCPRWLALALLEGDPDARHWVGKTLDDPEAILALADQARSAFEDEAGLPLVDHLVACRSRCAAEVVAETTNEGRPSGFAWSDRIDMVLLNRWLAPLFVVATAWTLYELSIVEGYELTKLTWPLLAHFRNLVAGLLPDAGFLHDPQLRTMSLWLVDSANTLLNYVPIFLILFALIAILEDSGYMARIAFIFDRILNQFGLHGQSTLPYILGGVFAGGCSVPGVMATKGIPDPKARLATILTVPYMNCLAKVPLYTLLINIYFPSQSGLILFYLSTLTIVVALLVAKLLSVTVLRRMETAPFVMELPPYHLPTAIGVVRRSVDRTWLYIKKVGTLVVAVAAVIYVALQFPDLPQDRIDHYERRAEAAIAQFYHDMDGNPLRQAVPDLPRLTELVNLHAAYRAETLIAGGGSARRAIDAALKRDHPSFAPFIVRSRDRSARQATRALRTLATARLTLRREMKQERLVNSVLGQIGRGLESVTWFAGFDWRINVALLSSFAARESSVATLGVLFDQQDGAVDSLEDRMEAAPRLSDGALTAAAVMSSALMRTDPPVLMGPGPADAHERLEV